MRLKSTWMRMDWGMVILGMFFVFMLQGCTTPLVSVDVKVGNCAPGKDDGPGACSTTAVPAGGGTYGGTQCLTGVRCTNEGTSYGCPRNSGQKCKTVDQGGKDCVCKCV